MAFFDPFGNCNPGAGEGRQWLWPGLGPQGTSTWNGQVDKKELADESGQAMPVKEEERTIWY